MNQNSIQISKCRFHALTFKANVAPPLICKLTKFHKFRLLETPALPQNRDMNSNEKSSM